MQGTAIVPYQQIVCAPTVTVNELVSSRMHEQEIQNCFGFLLAHSDEISNLPAEKEGLPTRLGVRTDDRMNVRWIKPLQLLLDLGAEMRKTRASCDVKNPFERVDHAAKRRRQRLVRGVLAREHGI